jgi:crotonobetainyl-CoA:carnitine CoA-transferase CaiB-like acyl-CoA transferase
MDSVLGDIMVLDLTQVLAGPFAVTMLSDLGADVIKIEPPSGGYSKNLSGLPPEYKRIMGWRTGRGRRAITIDFSQEKGKRLFLDLVKKCDVVVQNFSVGVMDKLGIGYSVLSKANPAVIYCSISGFGETGPLRNKRAYDPTIQAYSGLNSMTGFPDQPPVRVGIQVADYVGATYAVIGILAALRYRDISGKGQMIDCSMYDAMVAWTGGETLTSKLTGMERQGNTHPYGSPAELFQTKEGKYFMYGVQTDSQWEEFLRMIGKEQLIQEKWNFGKRWMNKPELNRWAAEWAKTKTLEEAIAECDKHKLVNAPIITSAELRSAPQAIARECFIEIEDETGKLQISGPTPPKLSLTPSRIKGGPPRHGQHNEEVFTGILGYNAKEVAVLKEEGVI